MRRRSRRAGSIPTSLPRSPAGSKVQPTLRRHSGMTTRRVAWRRSDEVEADEHCTLTIRDVALSLSARSLAPRTARPSGSSTASSPIVPGDDRRARPRPSRVRDADDRARAQREGQLDARRGGGEGAPGLHRRRSWLQPVHEHAADPAPRPGGREVADDPGRVDPVPGARRGQGRPDLHPARRFTYHYASGTFEADLSVDDDGLVAEYADWRRTGFAFGPDDTAPLDAQPGP